MDIYVARQPIFNGYKKAVGYELLFRNGLHNAFPETEGNTATSSVIDNSFMSMGIDNVIGNKKAFINFPRQLLQKGVPYAFDQHKIVIEILETEEADDELIDLCRAYKEKGYLLALDDFILTENTKKLAEVVHLIKFDFYRDDMETIRSWKQTLQRPGLRFLAEKIETYEQFSQALEEGFHLFQGFFFSKPEVMHAKGIANQSSLSWINFMAKSNEPQVQFAELEKIIMQDLGLAYRMLHYINSAALKRKEKVSSIHQALALLGENGIRQFAALVALTQLGTGKPEELVKDSILRAKFLRELALQSSDQPDSGELFTLGLFSLIDAVIDDKLENILQQLPLHENIKKALLNHEPPLGDYVLLAEHYEHAEWEKIPPILKRLNLQELHVCQSYVAALDWADSLDLSDQNTSK
jgi:EAL and modified HD-GYP domain-containing signal transduction protein